jgi:S-adenosylmethionine decarboxylase
MSSTNHPSSEHNHHDHHCCLHHHHHHHHEVETVEPTANQEVTHVNGKPILVNYAEKYIKHVECECCQDAGFEGPEKRLELDFRPIPSDLPIYRQYKEKHKNSEEDDDISNYYNLMNVSDETWQSMLDLACCRILSKKSNEHFISYVLSESSLFIFKRKLVIKTCGTTTLLGVLKKMKEIAATQGLEAELVIYSRKNYVFPHRQPHLHSSFEVELSYLTEEYPGGEGHVVGSVLSDHWYIYICDMQGVDVQIEKDPDQTLEVLMHDLDPKVMRQFMDEARKERAPGTTIEQQSGIDKLLPGSEIDSFEFDPCGYSMNGLLGKTYWTIHITPEDSCSFVSFETNVKSSKIQHYSELIERVIHTFQPGRFTVTLFADDHWDIQHDLVRTPSKQSLSELEHTTLLDQESFKIHNEHLLKTYSAFTNLAIGDEYKLKSKTFYEFTGGYNLTFTNFAKIK